MIFLQILFTRAGILTQNEVFLCEACILSVKVKKGRLTLPARASVWYTATSAVEKGMSFIFTPIFTRALTPEEYGLYPLYVSFLSLFTIIITLELSGNVIYRGLAKFKGREDEFICSALGVICLSFSLVLLPVLLVGEKIAKLMGLGWEILFFLILQVFFSGILNLYSARCRFFYEYKTPSVINASIAILSPALSFLLINLTRVRASARIIAPLAVTALAAVPLGILIVKRGRRIFSLEIWRFIFKLDLPLLPHFFATAVIAQSGKIIVARFFGEEALAKYSVVFSMGFVFSLITVGINSALAPWVNRKLSSGGTDKISEVMEPAFALFALMTLCGFCFSPEGLAFLAPREYHEALAAIYPLGISVLVGFLVTVINSALLFYEKSHLVSVASIITALVSVTLGFTVTARYGYIAAAFVQLASSLVLFGISSIMLGGVSQKRIINPSSHLLVTAFAGAASLPIYLLRHSTLSRSLLFLALALLALPIALKCKTLIMEKGNARQ